VTPLRPAQRAVLAANPWFATLAPPQRQALLGAATLTHLRPGEQLFRLGEPVGRGSGCFYGLLAGLVKVSTLRADGREAILTVLEPGNWFGEISLIDGAPRTHDGTALTPLDLLVVPADAFNTLRQDAAFANAIAALLAGRVRALYALLQDTTLQRLRTRVARRLLSLAHGDATQAPEVRLGVRLPQEALAMMLGVSRQTLSAELARFAREGVITRGYRRIEIASLPALQAIAAQD
jgi:CRP/FNR family transcriptional regulator, cyclic AMP receptor protein